MKKRPSIRDIAKKLGVSPTTISFVLNGKGKEQKISSEVIQKILDYTREVNYKPNQVAQSLRTGKTNILVFMVEDISNYFFAKIARIIEDIAYKKGYKVLFCSNENNDKRSKDLINIFYKRQVDGFIIIPSPGIRDEVEDLIKAGMPVVLFDRYFEDLDTSHVVIDNENAGYNATNHLIKNGFKRIGFITTDSDQNQMINRLNGYVKAMDNRGYATKILKIPFGELSSKSSELSLNNFILTNQLDSVFFSTNYLTQTGLKVLKKNNPNLLKNIGMITFDDNELFQLYDPTITAVNQPLERIGKKLMEIILSQINSTDTQYKSQQEVLEAELFVRESSQMR